MSDSTEATRYHRWRGMPERFLRETRRTGLKLLSVLARSAREYTDDYCPQLAAAISYHVLFSIFPLVIFFVSVAGLVLNNDSVRESFTRELLDAIPLSSEAEADLENAVDGLATPLSAVGLISLVALLWSARGMMGAIRQGLNSAWDVERAQRRTFLKAKVVELLLVASFGVLVGLSIGLTIAVRIIQSAADDLGPFSGGASGIAWFLSFAAPFLLSFSAFVFLYHVVPATRPTVREVLPGAIIGALVFEAVKNGFAFYLANFANYNAVYGSIGAIIGFLFFVYLGASVFLFGAEVAAEWPRVRVSELEAAIKKDLPPDASRLDRIRARAKRLL